MASFWPSYWLSSYKTTAPSGLINGPALYFSIQRLLFQLEILCSWGEKLCATYFFYRSNIHMEIKIDLQNMKFSAVILFMPKNR